MTGQTTGQAWMAAVLILAAVFCAACSGRAADRDGKWGLLPARGEAGFQTRACMNMGNALDAPIEGDWGWRLEPYHFSVIAKAGFDTVRIPIRWSAHTGPAPAHTIEPAFLERVDTVIRQARDVGLHVIVNVHHFEALMDDPAAHRDQFLAIWRQLSAHYQDLPGDVSFELLNAPHGALDGDRLWALLREAITIVRDVHPERPLIVGAGRYSALSTLPEIPAFKDPNIIPTFHYYDPFAFTHQDAVFLPERVRPVGPTPWGTPEDRDRLSRDALMAGEFRVLRGRPVLMGEFGVYDAVDLDQRLAWTGAVRRRFENWDIAWCLWNFTATFQGWDAEEGTWVPGMLEALGREGR